MTASMIIDAYTHFTPKNLLHNLTRSGSTEAERAATHMGTIEKRFPSFNTVSDRIREMDEFGIDMQISNVHCIVDPNIFQMPEKTRSEIVNSLNTEFSALMDESSGRMIGIGSASFGENFSCDMSVIDRAVDTLELRGFMVPTNIRGMPVDKFELFWNKMNELEMPVFIHPVDYPPENARGYELEMDMMHVLGWPYETALILTRMALQAFPSKFPKLKIISHHMGGNASFLLGRIAESYDGKTPSVGSEGNRNVKTEYNLREAFGHFYYDTAVGGSEEAVKLGFNTYGPDHVIFATDYPWGPNGGRTRLETYPEVVKKAIPEEYHSKVFEENISNLLGL